MDWIKQLFIDFREWAEDFFVDALDSVLSSIAGAIESLDPPDFLLDYSIGDYLPADVLYFLNLSGLDTAFSVLAGAIVFRVMRKILTFGIW